MKIACLMMQKNEDALLGVWLGYYSALVGPENLYVYDNGSTSEETIRLLVQAEAAGVNVDWTRRTKADFEAKGDIIAAKIREFDETDAYDMYFPLDCDEFIGVIDPEAGPVFEPDRLLEEIAIYQGARRALLVRNGLDNHPGRPGLFRSTNQVRKTFFPARMCASLDLGYHDGQSVTGNQPKNTRLVYVHFHWKPYEVAVRHSREKLAARIDNFDRETLIAFRDAKKSGRHLVHLLLLSGADEYDAMFDKDDVVYVPVPSFVARLRELGLPLPWADDLPDPAPSDPAAEIAARLAAGEAAVIRFGAPDQPEADAIVGAQTLHSPVHGVGWTMPGPRREDRMRSQPGLADPGFVLGFEPAELLIDLPAGRYTCRLVCGDTEFANHDTQIDVDGLAGRVAPVRTLRYHYVETTLQLVSTGAPVSIRLSSPGENWVLNRITLEPAPGNGRAEVVQRDYLGLDCWTVQDVESGGFRALKDKVTSLARRQAAVPTGQDRTAYLEVARGIVESFLRFQGSQGEIVDPLKGEEFQYATPAYAYTAALLVADGAAPELEESARGALDWSIRSFSRRKAATKHEDFFPFFIANALRHLAPLCDPELVAEWRQLLGRTKPHSIYRHQAGGRNGPGSNWNCKALAGEYMLHQAGIRMTPEFAEGSLAMQGRFFANPYGLYEEGPSVYDIFPRCWLGWMLRQGYHGNFLAELSDTLGRGALTSLFQQMPDGSLFSGGRSAHHLWGDALQSLCYEMAAAQLADVDARDGRIGVFKRAARRALAGFAHIRKSAGEFSIARNRMPHEMQNGFEKYSSVSQYNLLLGSILALAYEAAERTEGSLEASTPAETGDYVFELPHNFGRVLANGGGSAISVALKPSPGQYPLGLQQAMLKGRPALLGLSDPIPTKPAFTLVEPPGETRSHGLSWREGDDWISLASHPERVDFVRVSDLEEGEGHVGLTLTYEDADGAALVVETYRISESEITIDYAASPVAQRGPTRIDWFVMEGDGEARVEVRTQADGLILAMGGHKTGMTVPGCGTPVLDKARFSTRTGFARAMQAEGLSLVLSAL